LIYELEQAQYFHEFKTDTIGRITHVFFAHPDSLLLLKSHPDVLLMDCTYKTNRFKIPLLNIVGSTGLNTTFFVAFVFLSQETTPNYEWAMQILKKVFSHPDYTFPSVVVTDREVALITALRLTFPDSKRLLCQWHVNKNVLSHVSSYFEEGEERDVFMFSWSAVLASTSTNEYRERWAEPIDRYNDNFGPLVDYLKDT
jgi:MULE transposase domain